MGERADIAEAKKAMTTSKWSIGKELKELPKHLTGGEKVIAMATGRFQPGSADPAVSLIALTTKRVILIHVDDYRSFVPALEVEDYPLEKFTSATWETGTLRITGTVDVELDQVDSADGDRLATALRDTINHPAEPARSKTEDVFDLLRKLGELRDAGIVSLEEFIAKKTELLNRI